MKKYIASFLFAVTAVWASAQVPMIGEIRLFAGNFAPVGWAFCNGQVLSISQNETLFTLIGTTYGGDGQNTFALPNLNGRVAVGAGQGPGLSTNYVLGQTGGNSSITFTTSNLPAHNHAIVMQNGNSTANADTPSGALPASTDKLVYGTSDNAKMANNLTVTVSQAGSSQPQNNMQPYLGLNYIIALEGVYMGNIDSYIGEIKMVSMGQVPNGWMACNGQLLPIAQNQALFALLGTQYGGNGQTTFALPDMRGRIPIGRGQSQSGTTYVVGETGGVDNQSLNVTQLAAHSHLAAATSKVYDGIGNADTPVGNYAAVNPQHGNEFSTTTGTGSYGGSYVTDAVGGSQPFSNVQPYCTLQYIICVQGIFPSQY